MREMGTEPIDVIGGRANLIVTKRAMGRFFSSMSRRTQTTRQDSRFMTRDRAEKTDGEIRREKR